MYRKLCKNETQEERINNEVVERVGSDHRHYFHF